MSLGRAAFGRLPFGSGVAVAAAAVVAPIWGWEEQAGPQRVLSPRRLWLDDAAPLFPIVLPSTITFGWEERPAPRRLTAVVRTIPDEIPVWPFILPTPPPMGGWQGEIAALPRFAAARYAYRFASDDPPLGPPSAPVLPIGLIHQYPHRSPPGAPGDMIHRN